MIDSDYLTDRKKYGDKHTLNLYMKCAGSITKESEKYYAQQKNPRPETCSDNVYLKTHTEKFAYTSFSREKVIHFN